VRDVCAGERFELRQFILIAISDGDVESLFEESESDSPAEASGAARDENHLSAHGSSDDGTVYEDAI
jgi:hypothetical protein